MGGSVTDRTFFIIQSLWIKITMPDDTTRDFYLEAPTAQQDAFTWGFRTVQVQADFDNPNFKKIKGYKKYRHVASLNYAWHTMPYHLLLIAKKIELKHPPGFGSTDHYITFDCLLENDEALKTYQNSLVGAMANASTYRDVNRIKSGAITLNFVAIDALEWSDVEQVYFNQNMDSSHITGDSTEVTADSTHIIITE